MKNLSFFFWILAVLVGVAPAETFEPLLESGKSEFTKDFDTQDYAVAVAKLEQAVALRPKNAEAHYYLGYAYSRVNAKDGSSMMETNVAQTRKTSEQFELVNKLTPRYTGGIVVLDPYSKLSSEWGSLAFAYWNKNQQDSARWAFREGKKRGGFGEFFLAQGRQMLDLCGPNAILLTSGDNVTIPLWYVQILEGYRSDVTVIDVSLLNTPWYPKHLSALRLVEFDLPKAVVDTLDHLALSQDSTMVIGKFSWVLKTDPDSPYLLRGGQLLLSLLRSHLGKRPFYFTFGFAENAQLSLAPYLESHGLVDYLNVDGQSKWTFQNDSLALGKALSLAGKMNANSYQELNTLDHYRFDLLYRAGKLLEKGELKEGKGLLELLDSLAPPKRYPYQNPQGPAYEAQVRALLQD